MFATDIVLSFFTAYYDQEVLITDHKMIARNYLKWVSRLCFRRPHSLLPPIASLAHALLSANTVLAMLTALSPFRGRLRFWVDIIAWFPFDYVIVEAIWPPCFVNNNARYVSLLKLLRLVRAKWQDQQVLCQPLARMYGRLDRT